MQSLPASYESDDPWYAVAPAEIEIFLPLKGRSTRRYPRAEGIIFDHAHLYRNISICEPDRHRARIEHPSTWFRDRHEPYMWAIGGHYHAMLKDGRVAFCAQGRWIGWALFKTIVLLTQVMDRERPPWPSVPIRNVSLVWKELIAEYEPPPEPDWDEIMERNG